MKRATNAESSIGRRRRHARTDPGSGYQQRQESLRKAAGMVFLRQGFQAASMNDIALAVGTDRATLYYYYASKQELFFDVVRRALDEVAAMAEEVAASAGPATDRLRRLVRGQLDAYDRHYPCLHLYLQEDVPRVAAPTTKVGKDLHRLGQRCEKALASIIEDGIARGELRPDLDPRLIATAITGAVSWSHRWFKPGGRAPGAAVGEAYAEILLHGIATSPVPPGPKRARRPPAGR